MPRFNPFGFFAMFAIGALGGGLQVRWAKYRNALFDAIGLAGLAWGIYLMDRQLSAETADGWGWLGVPYGFPWFVLAVGLFLSAAPSSVLLGRLLDNPVTRYIARISFGIYIWHYVVLELVRLYWDPQIDHGQASDPVRFVVTCSLITVITLTVAHLSYHLVENPVIQWARGKERRSAGSASLSQNSAVAG